MARNLQKHSRASLIVTALGDGLGDLLVGALQPAKALKYGASRVERDYFRGSDTRSLRKAVKSLRERKFIHANSYKLTDSGWEQYIAQKMLHADMLSDDRVLMIVFDIPESRRSDRDRLRKLLRKSGCISLQRSILVTPFNLIKELGQLLAATKLEHCVRLYYAEQVQLSSDRN